MALNPRDRPSGPAGARPGVRREGSTRPREASRPERRSSTTDRTGISLCPTTFVEISADQERHAIEALAELLVPFLTGPRPGSPHQDAPFDVTPSTGEG